MRVSAQRVDLAFGLEGRFLPRDHRWALAEVLVRALPALAADPLAAVHPVKLAPGTGEAGLLSGRSRLVVRVSREAAHDVLTLDGRELEVDGFRIRLHAPRLRELLPHATLYAHFVAAVDGDETGFLSAVDEELAGIGVRCPVVCGRAQSVRGPEGPLTGFSLMLQQLRAADAIRVLERGLGAHRLMGCGVFVAHKSAAAVGVPE